MPRKLVCRFCSQDWRMQQPCPNSSGACDPTVIFEPEGLARCAHGHQWLSPPVVCPFCESRRLRVALKYYADDQHWFEVTNAMGVRCQAIEERNGGGKAREALILEPA